MNNNSTELIQQGKSIRVVFGGDMTDGCSFPKIEDLAGVDSITIDLEKTNYINSTGIRQWILWTESIQNKSPNVSIFLENVQAVFVRTQAVIFDLLPAGTKVVSFFLPYFCESCNKDEFVLAHTKELLENFKSDGEMVKEIESYNCSICGKKIELDAFPLTFVKFIREYGIY